MMKMKEKVKILIVFLFLFAFLIPTQARSQDVSLERQEIQKQLDGLKAQIKALEERLRLSEEKQKSAEEKLEAAEEKQREPLAEMMTTLGDKIEIGGELAFDFVDVQDDTDFHEIITANGRYEQHPHNPKPRFEMDQVRLKFKVKPMDNIEFKAKVDFEDIDEVELDEGYMTFEEENFPFEPFGTEISAGFQNRFIENTLETYTETCSLAETAFWKDADLGIQYKGTWNPFYWHVSLTNGQGLRAKPIGQDSADRDIILQDHGDNTDLSGNKELGLGFGYQDDFGNLGMVDVLGFAYFGRLAPHEGPYTVDDYRDGYGLGMLKGDQRESYTEVRGVFPNYNTKSTDDDQQRYGFNLAYMKDSFEAGGQYIYAVDGDLRRHVWFAQSSYKFPMEFKYLKAVQPLFRCGAYDINQLHNYAHPLTWDRESYTLALLNHITESSVILKLEYTFNREGTGRDQMRNDEFLAQLEYKF